MAEIVVKLVNGELAGKTAQELRKEYSAAANAVNKAKIGTEEWIKANERLEKAKSMQADLKKQIEGTTEASTMLKKAWNKLPGAGFFNQIADSMGMMKKGVGGLISNFGMLKTAIVSTGIGALVIILGFLIEHLTGTQAGIDKVTSVTRPLQAVMASLRGVLQELSEKVFKRFTEALSNPKQAILDLGKVILDNIINRFKAVLQIWPAIQKIFAGDFKNGVKDLANAFIQMGTGVEDVIGKVTRAGEAIGKVFDEAWEKGKRLDDLQKSIEKQEINQIKRLKMLELDLKKQKDVVEDVGKSWDTRREAASKALAIQQALANEELSLLDKKIEKMRIEHSLNDTSREQQKELAELEAKRFEVLAKQTEQSIEWKKKITEFNIAQAAQEKAITDNIINLRLQAQKDGLAKEIALIEQETQAKIEALIGSEEQITEQKLLLEKIRNEKVAELRAAFEEEEKERALASANEKNDLLLATELNKLYELFDAKKIGEMDYAQVAAQLAIAHQEEKLNIIKEGHGVESLEYQNAYAQLLEMQRQHKEMAVDLKKQELQEQLAAASGAIGLFGDTFNAIGALQREGSEQAKQMAIAAATMSAIQGSINAYTSTLTIPMIGTQLAPIAAMVALTAGMANVRKIASTPLPEPPKAEKGMVLAGPSHAQGGIMVEAEGDEIILTKGVYRDPRLRSLASAINVAAGGRKFETGGPVRWADQSRPAMSRTSSTDSASLIDPQAIADATMKAASMMMDQKIKNIRVQNVVTDTEDKLNEVRKIENEAHL